LGPLEEWGVSEIFRYGASGGGGAKPLKARVTDD